MSNTKVVDYWKQAEGVGRLSRLYGQDSERLAAEALRYEELESLFLKNFGTRGNLRFFSAPGRSEIAGNHTDHQWGKVIAASVDLDVIAAVVPREDGIIELASKGYGRCDRVNTNDLAVQKNETGHSAALIRGVVAGLVQQGYKVGGFSAFTSSEVPSGSGLSSSAAFEILLVTILDILYNDGDIPPLQRAKIGQFAENTYFGKPSGLLDQSGCAVGGFAALDFAGGAMPAMKQIQVDFARAGYAMVVTQTGGSHANLTHEYAAIPGDMRCIASALGGSVLSEVDPAAFYASIPSLREKCGDRAVLRAIHFFTEQERVVAQGHCLEEGRIEDFLALVNESGLSSELQLQNITPAGETVQQELALALALSRRFLHGKKGAVRVHGGGFGGTIQAYIALEDVEAYCADMNQVFGQGSAKVLGIRPVGGVELV